MKRLLIDTNIYSYALKGDENVVSILRKATHIGISFISIGELFSGFKDGQKETENREELYMFLDSPRVQVYLADVETAEYYSEILNNLRKIGKSVPTNDLWIAAIAFQNGLKLFSRDKHFKHISGLTLI